MVEFKKQAVNALNNSSLQQALGNLKNGFVSRRALAISNLPEFNQLRDRATTIKNQTLASLDTHLEQFESHVLKQGGQVHWASTDKEACQIVIQIAHSISAKLITKGKSMVAEEIHLNEALASAGFAVVETDLGEYIIQLRNEKPSHIVVPAIHVLKEQVAENFFSAHSLPSRSLKNPEEIVNEARLVLREKFLKADVGITGANFLIAENGATVIVTNEGNGDLTQTCAKIHIVIASIEKVVPTVEDALTLLRLLPRSATGQEITSYVTFSMGPRRPEDLDGPEQFHVILVDNGRSNMLGTFYQDMLRCIRCGACLNHCPVYAAIGGQAYGSVYPGPMGAVLTPSLQGIQHSAELPNASTFCGRCEEVCPMKIPLPQMMRSYREEEFSKRFSPIPYRKGIQYWAFLAKRPRLYHFTMKMLAWFLSKNIMSWKSQGKTFHQLWREKK